VGLILSESFTRFVSFVQPSRRPRGERSLAFDRTARATWEVRGQLNEHLDYDNGTLVFDFAFACQGINQGNGPTRSSTDRREPKMAAVSLMQSTIHR
jgi:hypothetical protein